MMISGASRDPLGICNWILPSTMNDPFTVACRSPLTMSVCPGATYTESY
jgi:hypothetical protein